jgi:hypothetical protein
MITEIKIPNGIETLEQFNEWVKSMSDEKQDLEIWMKRRTNFYPYDFTIQGDKVHYLISDGISSGRSKVKNFGRIFKFQIRTV